MTKTVRIKQFPKVTDFTNINKDRNEIIENLYQKFQSEDNTNNMNYALNVLNGFVYVPNKFQLWDGRYIRMIDTKQSFNMKLRIGGFLVEDDGYHIKLLNNEKIYVYDKRNCITFMMLTENDLFINKIKSLIS